MRLRPADSAPLAAAPGVLLAGCTAAPLLSYRIDVPAQTLTAVGTAPVHDGRARFREICCRLAGAPLGNCDPGDKGAAESLERTTRLTWLATHPLPSHVRYFSVGAFANHDDISDLLQPGWNLLATIDPRNDGLLLFSDQVIPGATLLGCAHADHAAVVLPAEETAPPWVLSFLNRTQYPQDALLDAILRTVGEQLDTPR